MMATQDQAKQRHNEDLTMSTNRIIKNQVVFRIKDPNKSARAPRRSPKQKAASSSPEAAYHPRRAHQKSRTGCGNCKKRRVKCDETKPSCNKCEAYGISCDYAALQLRSRESSQESSSARSAAECPNVSDLVVKLSAVDLATRIHDTLQLTSYADEPMPSYIISKSVTALHIFVNGLGMVGTMSERGQKISGGAMIQLGFQTPYLLHAVLGVAAIFLRFGNPDDKTNHVLEAYHWQRALKLYQTELQSSVQKHNMDGLLSTCMMMGALSFSDASYNPIDSWLFSSKPSDLNWLLVQGGLRYLLESCHPWLVDSMWWDFFMETKEQNFEGMCEGRPDFFKPEISDLCGIDETSTEDNNPYYWPVRMLSIYLDMETTNDNFSSLCGFMGRLLPPYINLLLQKDERAILLLGIWEAKMCESKTYWTNHRLLSECIATCMFLEDSSDPRILKLLEYPASQCGYTLKHMGEVEQMPILPILATLPGQ